MREDFTLAASLGVQKYQKISPKTLQYGTSGFRDKASELTHVMYRMGLLSVLLSKAKNGSTIGIMITASHNPEEDNGIKLCDPSGEMIDKEWENYATDLVNVSDDSLPDSLSMITCSSGINYDVPANVYLARDTRKSSEFLAKAAIDGVKALNGEVKDFGLLTTPQLHFVVYCKSHPEYGTPTPQGYYKKLSSAFNSLIVEGKNKAKNYIPEVYVDGANGIGALKLKELQTYIDKLQFKIFNDGSTGVLNYKCGADFVNISQQPPEGCEVISGKRYASFDGDADRVVYFYKTGNGNFHLLDGGKIAALVAKFLKDLVQVTGLNLSMRVIQTAYANGSSTKYTENELNIPVVCVPTGVKYLHHEALKYDVGIYFEANGHGTVVFSEDAKLQIREIASSPNSSLAQKAAAKKLLSTMDVINEAVGDAISDMLLTEIILYDFDWDISDWDSIYTDFPNRQLKMKVPDRNVLSTTDAARKCVKPEGLQEEIDKAVAKYEQARSFVRPSGTEDIVRVYAEAHTQEAADKLAEEVVSLVKRFTENV
ncbi:phosphoacetylglucosamine mutase [Trichonephila inaurata madagascariensis]|uniref:Phosphoacetylglucosamine mutase n=1 Tax=Trichonephila inaurata madagascariensis TaxID=2747483 RepID=A0A8X6YLS5_9ARAC|nr:phosphoacetylglucosamine mutase [Trichonephila inaurata madagascariensis]